MKKIPKGRVSTYKIIANKIGTNACRAVGNACRRNPNPPTIPCHRVVRSDGGIGGFAGETYGKQIKKKVAIIKISRLSFFFCLEVRVQTEERERKRRRKGI